jgi:hypothetical protein
MTTALVRLAAVYWMVRSRELSGSGQSQALAVTLGLDA